MFYAVLTYDISNKMNRGDRLRTTYSITVIYLSGNLHKIMPVSPGVKRDYGYPLMILISFALFTLIILGVSGSKCIFKMNDLQGKILFLGQ